jgi:hypothetical protein
MLKATAHYASMPAGCCEAVETRFQKGLKKWDQTSPGFVQAINAALRGDYMAGQFAPPSSMKIVTGDHYSLVVYFTDGITITSF